MTCPIVLVHLEPLKEDNLSTKDKTADVPNVSFTRRFHRSFNPRFHHNYNFFS